MERPLPRLPHSRPAAASGASTNAPPSPGSRPRSPGSPSAAARSATGPPPPAAPGAEGSLTDPPPRRLHRAGEPVRDVAEDHHAGPPARSPMRARFPPGAITARCAARRPAHDDAPATAAAVTIPISIGQHACVSPVSIMVFILSRGDSVHHRYDPDCLRIRRLSMHGAILHAPLSTTHCPCSLPPVPLSPLRLPRRSIRFPAIASCHARKYPVFRPPHGRNATFRQIVP